MVLHGTADPPAPVVCSRGTAVVEVDTSLRRFWTRLGGHGSPTLPTSEYATGEVPVPPSCVGGSAVVLYFLPRGVDPLSWYARVGDRNGYPFLLRPLRGAVSVAVAAALPGSPPGVGEADGPPAR